MVRNYEILDPRIPNVPDASSLPKNVTLRVGGISLDHFSKCTERTTDVRTLNSLKGRGVLNECYIDLTLDKLRELDSDREAQDAYIMSRSKFLDRGLINVLIVKLRLKADEILEALDYEYLNSLLTWSRNHIYVMPIIEFEGELEMDVRLERYMGFVDTMLREKDTWMDSNWKIGMSTPEWLARRHVGTLFDLYRDADPTFIVVDLDNKRMDRPSQISGSILNHFRKSDEERTFMYAVNAKPYKKGADVSAWDIYLTHGSFNAIGPTHTRPHYVQAPSGWSTMGRIFDDERISYPKVDENHRDEFMSWMETSYGIQLDVDFKRNQKGLYTFLRRYNFEKSNGVLYDFSEALRSGDDEYISGMRDRMPEEMKGVNILERRKRTCRTSGSP